MASSVFKSLGSGIVSNLGNAFKDAKFAMQNLGTEGTLAQDAMVSASGNMGMALAGIGIAATAAAVAIGVKAVGAASDFQASMIKSQAEAGLTKQQMTDMGNAILDMAPKVGQGPKALADGLFFVESAGFAGKDALNTLRISAEMASNDMSDTSTVAKGLTAAVKAFGYSTSDSAMVANQMTVTVSNGQMTMSAYANVIGKTAQMAHNFHVGMSETNAALDVLTNNGFPSAATAGTALQNVLQQFDGNTAKVAKNVRALGGTFDEHKFKSMDLQHQVEYLSKAMKGHEDQLQHVLGGSKSAVLGYNALKTGAAEYGKDLQKLNDAQKNGGAETQSFAATQQGFAFQMKQAQAAVDALMIKLGQHLLPVLSQIVGAVAPAINNFIAWESKTHTLENALNIVGGVIGNVGKAIGGIIGFFQKNQTAMDALKAVLIGVGAGILAFAATAIPALVAGFIAWGIAAGGAAIATLIAAAPFILIGAIIAAVVFGIIEAVQHWGAIVAWLKGIWGGISSWFSGLLNGIKVWFVWLWASIQADLFKAWQAIQNAVRIGIMVVLAILFAPIIAIAALFIWLYNHNTYFKKLIDAIVNIVKAGVAWLQKAWQDIVNWIVGAWNGLVAFATVLWDSVSMQIKIKFEQAIMFVQSVWNKISSFFVNAWNTYIAGPLTTLWKNVSGVFSAAWNTYIAKPLNDVWNSVSKWFTDLGTSAMNSGKNFIQMLVNGITSGAGAIWNAVSGIAKNIWKALGFHSPAEEGPGADADKWMPNLVSMLSSGLVAGVPKIQAAVNLVAQPLAVMGQPAHAGVSVPVAAPASAGGGGTTIIHQYTINAPALSKREAQTLADEISKIQNRQMRGSGNHVTWTSGGSQ